MNACACGCFRDYHPPAREACPNCGHANKHHKTVFETFVRSRLEQPEQSALGLMELDLTRATIMRRISIDEVGPILGVKGMSKGVFLDEREKMLYETILAQARSRLQHVRHSRHLYAHALAEFMTLRHATFHRYFVEYISLHQNGPCCD